LIRTEHHLILVCILFLACAGHDATAQRDKKKKPTETPLTDAKRREAEFFFTEGQKYFMLEDYTKAYHFFQRVVELNPYSPTVHYKMAEILSRSNNPDDLKKSAEAVETAITLDPKNKYFYLLGANIYGSLMQFEKATGLIEKMLAEVSNTEEYLYELAAFYLYDKKTEKALDTYNRAERLMGVNETSSLQKQKIYFEQGKITEGLAEAEKLIEAFPGEERYVLALAETLAQNKQLAQAIAYLEKHLDENPEAGNARMLLAGLYRDNGLEPKARELLLTVFDDPSVELDSKIIIVGTYNSIIGQQANSTVVDASIEEFTAQLIEKLVLQYPDQPNVYVVSGDHFLMLKKNKQALAQYFKAVKLGSTNFDTWQNLLYLETELEQFDSVRVHAGQALELFPNQAMVHYFNGYANLRKRHYREATVALEQAKKLSTANQGLVAEINGMLGDAYNGAQDYDKSDKAYDDALSYNPNNDLILNNYSYYLALRKVNLEKAEKMSAQLIKNHPNNSAYLDTHAWVLFMREKYKEARKVMERAMAVGEVSAVYHEHYGDILFKLGETDEAVRQWQKAKVLDASNELIDKKIANRRLY
jgi:tetratricopeptide (TPR) repeat protein